MNGQPGRSLRAGVTACFVLEGTMELLWKARLSVLPLEGDTCVSIANGVETEYLVEAVRIEFHHNNIAAVVGYNGGVPIQGEFEPSVVTDVAPVIVVSAVV